MRAFEVSRYPPQAESQAGQLGRVCRAPPGAGDPEGPRGSARPDLRPPSGRRDQPGGRGDASRAVGRAAEPPLLEANERDAPGVVEQLGEAGPVVVKTRRRAAEPAIFEVHPDQLAENSQVVDMI